MQDQEQAQQNEKEQNEIKSSFKELSELYLFDELYRFFKESTGLAITMSYLAMILSSMAYLAFLYHEFDINIVKYVTLEDILATPVKNPNIILAFAIFFLVLVMADMGNRFRAKQQIKYAGGEKPFGFKAVQVFFWGPKKRTSNIKTTAFSTLTILAVYIFTSASLESENIKTGQRNNVEITLAEGNEVVKASLLGTSNHYVFTYNLEKKESVIYYLQSIKSVKNISSTDVETIAPETTKAEENAATKSTE